MSWGRVGEYHVMWKGRWVPCHGEGWVSTMSCGRVGGFHVMGKGG